MPRPHSKHTEGTTDPHATTQPTGQASDPVGGSAAPLLQLEASLEQAQRPVAGLQGEGQLSEPSPGLLWTRQPSPHT